METMEIVRKVRLPILCAKWDGVTAAQEAPAGTAAASMRRRWGRLVGAVGPVVAADDWRRHARGHSENGGYTLLPSLLAEPDLPSWLIHAPAHSGRSHDAVRDFRHMRERGLASDAHACTALLTVLARARMTATARKLFDGMARAPLQRLVACAPESVQHRDRALHQEGDAVGGHVCAGAKCCRFCR
jgi:pentatricopeptide repeat protein